MTYDTYKRRFSTVSLNDLRLAPLDSSLKFFLRGRKDVSRTMMSFPSFVLVPEKQNRTVSSVLKFCFSLHNSHNLFRSYHIACDKLDL